MIGVRVCLDDAHEPDVAPLRLLEVLLDRVRGIDNGRATRRLAADQVRGAAEVVVHELREEHGGTVTAEAAISPEVRAGGGARARARPRSPPGRRSPSR